MGKQNNILTREILILAMWFIKQKVIFFRCRTDNRLAAYFSNILKYTNSKLLRDIDAGLKIVVSNFHGHFFISSEAIAFFCEDGFSPFLHKFLRRTHVTLENFKI